MEQIIFVVTPKCSVCSPTPQRKRYFPCIGCDKTVNADIKRVSANKSTRIQKIMVLHEQGFSLSYISNELGIARSTIFYIIKSYKNGCRR